VYDVAVANSIVSLALNTLGETIYRVGQAPKALLLYRISEATTKITSQAFVTGDKKSRVEVLGSGQQFVAYNVHPDTGRPYEWFGGAPHEVALWELPAVTREQLLEFTRQSEALLAAKFQPAKSGKGRAGQLATTGDANEDALMAIAGRKKTLDIGRDEIDQRLLDVQRYAEDYDFWLNVGMALHHQFRGSSEGLQIWDEWSQTASNYDEEATTAKWESFDAKTLGGVTFASVMHHSNIERIEAKWANLENYRDRIKAATDATALLETVGREISRDSVLSASLRDMLCHAVAAQLKTLGAAMSMAQIKKMLKPASLESLDPEALLTSFPWLDGWVYVNTDNLFFNLKTSKSLEPTAFDKTFGRLLLTASEKRDGLARPSVAPSDFACNVVQIPVVTGIGFQPSDVSNEIFQFEGTQLANRWRDTSPPPIPDYEWDDTQARCVDVFIQHVNNSAAEHPEVLMCYLAHLVQHRGQKIRWAPLLIGPQGSGKSVWGSVMAGVLGPGNAQMVPQSVIASGYLRPLVQSEFTVLDELKSRAHKFDIELALRDLITNSTATTTEKHLTSLRQPNHTNFMGTSNYDDALPIDETDRRWWVNHSRFQTVAQVADWDNRNPDYFSLLNDIQFDPSLAGAVKWYLLNYKIDNPIFLESRTRAPLTEAKRRMIGAGEDPAAQIVRDILDRRMCSLLTPEFVSIGLLRKQLQPLMTDKAMCDPTDRKLPRLLREVLKLRPSDWRPERPRGFKHSVFMCPSKTEKDLRDAFEEFKTDDLFDEAPD
jgi:hypothetical protein